MLLETQQFANKAYQIFQLREGAVGVDFETTGLSPYKGDRATIVGFTDEKGEKFSVFVDETIIFHHALKLFFDNSSIKYCAHNAKFELSFLKQQFGITPKGTIWDTEVMARLEKNNHLGYSLQKCAERVGETKHVPMLSWLKIRGNKGLHYKAPHEILIPYVEHDAYLSWLLHKQQFEIFQHWDKSSPVPIKNVVMLELATTPHLFDMESRGLLVDVDYCRRALKYEREKIRSAKEQFESFASVPFVDSRKTLQPLFDRHGICYGKTSLGNASFTEECLQGSLHHPIVTALLEHRRAVKRASSYWENFLELECGGVIHPSINQNRAQTGRMSISDPSCQNWPTENDDDPQFPIRRAFIARPDCVIASLDYSQMELRLMCDEAGDMGMVEALRSGFDFHQATADAAGVPRHLAKNGRFAKLYGAGVLKVAETLGIAYELAQRICAAIDESSPSVAAYSRELVSYAEGAPFGFNFLGRRYFFDSGFAYKYPNYRIQGGCGEILRKAIIKVAEFLKAHASPETFILIPIHDELVINVHKSDLHLLPAIRALMIMAHTNKRYLEMDVSVHVGPNFYDLDEFQPAKEEG